ncbi:MAG: dihydrolipoamide acetyltransferase family protein [Actinomycetes bacterium]
MAIEVTLPKLGLTMEEGTLEEWLVNDGDVISVGTPLLRLATDKIDVDVEAEAEGIIARAVPNGTTLPPGAVLGWLLAPGEAAPAGAGPFAAPAAAAVETAAPVAAAAPAAAVVHEGGRQFVSPNARRVAEQLGVDVTQVAGTGPNGRVVSEDVEAAAAAGTAKITSPLARRDAAAAGIDINAVQTDSGFVTRKDVRDAISGQVVTPPPAAATAGAVASVQETASIIPMKGMRGTIAARMVHSLTEMAQLTHGFEVTMDAVVDLRGTLKEQYRDLGLQVPSLNDFVVRAASLALRKHPILNSTIVDKEIHLLSHIHMGMAVAVPGGLMVPVIRDADTLSIFELARVTRELAEDCRAGSISLDALEGGTFAVTSLGTYGVDMFTPVINPGNVGILGVGRLRESGKWEGERFVKTQVLTLSLTFDHRVVDGAPAAEFLQTVNELLARPLVLLPGA